MKLSKLIQVTASMTRFTSNLARNATLYYESAERLQRVCDGAGVDGINSALQYGHVSELADFVASLGRLPTSKWEMVYFRAGLIGRP